MADREQPYDPYIPSAGGNANAAGQGQNGNHRTAALQAVCLLHFLPPFWSRRDLRSTCCTTAGPGAFSASSASKNVECSPQMDDAIMPRSIPAFAATPTDEAELLFYRRIRISVGYSDCLRFRSLTALLTHGS